MLILFIEDEENATVGLIALLEGKGYEVDIAESCDEAVERLRKQIYDLIILDIMIDSGQVLPNVAVREAGKELLLRIRSGGFGTLKTDKDVPVVAITAVSDLKVSEALESAGNIIILHKPITPEDSLVKIEKFIFGGESGRP